MKPAKPLWSIQVRWRARPAEAERLAVEAALAPCGDSLSSFESAAGKGWSLEVIAARKPSQARLDGLLRPISRQRALIARLPDRDWLAESRKGLPPLRIGPFLVHGAHDRGKAPPRALPLEIDAGLAFGTGRHETTAGCIAAMLRLKRLGFAPRNALDVGTGTGILAFAAAMLFDIAVLAGDNDKAAVRVARENAAINGLRRRVRILLSDGYRARPIRAGAPYDLITANILANPLIALSRDCARHLHRRGRVILSGLTRDQEGLVLAAHAAEGLALDFRQRRDDWSVLVLKRGHKSVTVS